MQLFTHCKKIIIPGVLLFAAVMTIVPLPQPVAAVVAPYNMAPFAKVSFTFDDGLTNALTHAAPTLAAHGLTGTSYITTGCVGMSTIPNTCPADPDVQYMTWQEIAQLRDTYGWEIGGHTVNHPQLATGGLTDAQLAAEIAGGKQALVGHGFNPVSFAAPYGDYDNRVLAEVAKSYAAHRGFWDVANNNWPYSNYILNNMQVQVGVPVNDVLARIDQTIAGKQWLVLTFHGISPTPSTDPEDYQYSTADLSTIAAYVKSKQDAGLLKAVNVKDGLVTSTTNLLPNAGLSSGIADGWATDTPANVTANSANHGSYPEPQNAVLMTAGASGASHLFSPKVTVQRSKTYMLQSFLNLTAITGGELGYYIDEYNINNDWIGGQWKRSKAAAGVSNEIFTYTPSSINVAKARLQVYVTPGSGVQAYVDTFQWFALEDVETPPPPPPTWNQLPNSSFDSGVSAGWTTNSVSAFAPDSGNHGSPNNPVHALRLLAGDSNASLFAPLVDVDHALAYNVTAYLNVQTLTGNEVAFYIDEYDIGGNWVSGQYKTAKRDTGIEIINFAYTPATNIVKKAGLQVILVANSGINGYLDDVRFLAPGGSSPPPPNLMPNGTFDNGIADGWTTDDPVNITADNTNQGSPDNPDKAVKLLSATVNRHLFAPHIAVSSAKSYNLSSYLGLRQISGGEIGFYIDEYDLNGNWVSGQYKTGVSTISAGDVSFGYLASSAAVSKAGLQIIVAGSPNTLAYLDNIRWFEN